MSNVLLVFWQQLFGDEEEERTPAPAHQLAGPARFG